jgi:hypothetical protein
MGWDLSLASTAYYKACNIRELTPLLEACTTHFSCVSAAPATTSQFARVNYFLYILYYLFEHMLDINCAWRIA